jgi:hypothetical protein
MQCEDAGMADKKPLSFQEFVQLCKDADIEKEKSLGRRTNIGSSLAG